MTLIEDPGVDLPLDDEIDRWLPAFGAASLQGGGAPGRPLTMAELLSHRAGIYSQKRRMTRRQTSLIRDFRRNLEAAVDGIAAEPLIAEPGEAFNYSGAGYCVLGRPRLFRTRARSFPIARSSGSIWIPGPSPLWHGRSLQVKAIQSPARRYGMR